MKVLVVIVTYNAEKYIYKCIEKLRNVSNISEIYVIDNNSTDKTIFILENIEFAKITIKKQSFNLGFGGANNLGFNYFIQGEFDFLLLLNQDVYFNPFYLFEDIKGDLEFYSKNVITPIHLNSQENDFDINFNKYLSAELKKRKCVVKKYNNRINLLIELNYSNAAFWLIPRQIVEKIGGFNPYFFHYGEDVNWAHRLNFHGFAFYCILNYNLVHDRLLFGNKGFFDSNNLERAAMLELLNINQSIIVSLLKVFLLLIFYIFKVKLFSPIKFLFNIITVLKVCNKLFLSSNSIRMSRIFEKEKNLTWLNK